MGVDELMDVHRTMPMSLVEAWEFDRLVQMALAEVGVRATRPEVIDSYPDGLGPLIERTYRLDDWPKFIQAKRLAFDAMGIAYEEGPYREYRDQLGSGLTR